MVCKADEGWVIWTLIYIPRPPVINNLVVALIGVAFFQNSLGTSFNYFSALRDNGMNLAEEINSDLLYLRRRCKLALHHLHPPLNISSKDL